MACGTHEGRRCSLSSHDSDGPSAFKGWGPKAHEPGTFRQLTCVEAHSGPVEEPPSRAQQALGRLPAGRRPGEAPSDADVETRRDLFRTGREDGHVGEAELVEH